MTLNTDLQAARSRVAVQQQQLESARAALAVAEHQAYSDALKLIADEVGAAKAADLETNGAEAVSNIELVLEGLGITPTPKSQGARAVQR